ncbi:uncharacterized protein METZ01_LOCUS298479, partial [marine metagenome]
IWENGEIKIENNELLNDEFTLQLLYY